jgi:hypothetical protein
MFDIRLTTPDLELRHLTESALGSLAAIFPEDGELDPSSTTYDALDPAGNRRGGGVPDLPAGTGRLASGVMGTEFRGLPGR